MAVISVVVPARDAAADLTTQLEALAAQTYRGPWEVVVADNGSSDGTRECALAARGRVPGLRVVDASTRRGVSHARNVGARAAHGEFVLFCDADDVVAPTWVEEMARAAVSYDAVGGALERETLNQRGTVGPGAARTEGLLSFPGFLPHPSGANCGVRASLFDELGGFDETHVGGGDDAEFFWRLQLAGHRVGFVAEAVVSYRQRRAMGELARQFFGYGVADPHLYRDFRARGMPRNSPLAVCRAWAHLVVLAPWYWADRARRRQWVKSVARRLGRIAGSARFRSLYL